MIEELYQNHPHEAAVNLTFHEIDSILRENGTSCCTIGLPSPEEITHEDLVLSPEAPSLKMVPITWRASPLLYFCSYIRRLKV